MRWDDFATVKFKPHELPPWTHARGSCGTYSLFCLTGLKLPTIEAECPKNGWWSDRAMRQFLKKHGYVTTLITTDLVHSTKPYKYEENLNHQHVILLSTHASEAEGTWQVAYNGSLYHGTEIEFFSGYELLINPLWTAYLVWHPKWKSSQSKKKEDLANYWISHQRSQERFHPQTGKWSSTKPKHGGIPPLF